MKKNDFIWAAFGSIGWRPGRIAEATNTGFVICFHKPSPIGHVWNQHFTWKRGHLNCGASGFRVESELLLRNPELKGKDKPSKELLQDMAIQSAQNARDVISKLPGVVMPGED